MINELYTLFAPLLTPVTKSPLISVAELQAHASRRQLFRLGSNDGSSYIGVINQNIAENKAFLKFTDHFLEHNLPVPKTMSTSEDFSAYIQEDLGDTTLLDVINKNRMSDNTPAPNAITLLEQALKRLVEFQVVASVDFDFSWCYPDMTFDQYSFLYDLESFKREFLDRVDVRYDREKLEEEFLLLATSLTQSPADSFVYRDFQSRNIMVKGGTLYFIDYQGGRRGPLQYDLVSLLYQGSAGISEAQRNLLTNSYLEELQRRKSVNVARFKEDLPNFVIVRMLQVLGVYGREGLGLGKEYFLKAISPALLNLSEQVTYSPHLNKNGSCKFPVLKDLTNQLIILFPPATKTEVKL